MDAVRSFKTWPASALILSLALVSFCSPAQARFSPFAESTRSTPPSAFLHQKAYTRAELLAQLAADPGARKGYAKIFHLPATRVVPYLKRHATEDVLSAPGKYTVYRVTSEGTIYPTVQRMLAGARVFAIHGAEAGAPAYISTFGDPMIAFGTAVTIRIVRKPAAVKLVTKVSPSQETLVPTSPDQTVVDATVAAYARPLALAPAVVASAPSSK